MTDSKIHTIRRNRRRLNEICWETKSLSINNYKSKIKTTQETKQIILQKTEQVIKEIMGTLNRKRKRDRKRKLHA